MKRAVLTAGFGGQGILLIGQLLAEAAMRDGYHTTWFPSYGPEMRGGTANCTTIYSDEEIGSPIEATYHAVIAMNQPSLERFGPRVRPGGVLLVNASMAPVRLNRKDVTEVHVSATDLARAAGSERAANAVMLGALLVFDELISEDALNAAIDEAVGKRHPELIGVNRTAILAGRAASRTELRNRHLTEGSMSHVVMHG